MTSPHDPTQVVTLPRHGGVPGHRDVDYLVAPDPAIGRVLSAESNRTKRGWTAMDTTYRSHVIQFPILGVGLGWVAGTLAVGGPPESMLPWEGSLSVAQRAGQLAVAVLAGLVGLVLVLALRPRRSSYVGLAGVQSHVQMAFGPGRTRAVRFADCADLRTLRTRHLRYGAYTHTSFDNLFVDVRGATLFRINGQYDERWPNNPSDALRFALAAERAWEEHKSARTGRLC
jgi:hypothetical protein